MESLSGNKQACTLRNFYTQGFYLNARKHTSNKISVWLQYTPVNLTLFPDQPFYIIMKTFAANNKLQHKYKIHSDLLSRIDLLKKASNPTEGQQQAFISALDIWDITDTNMNTIELDNSKVIAFAVSGAILREMAAAEKIELLIPTRTITIQLTLTAKELQAFQEFKITCGV